MYIYTCVNVHMCKLKDCTFNIIEEREMEKEKFTHLHIYTFTHV
ncbi:hypothetical protein BAPAT_pXO20044 (plasmid) [Bacillus anthracis str. SVA11]|nr:hypothetical protein BAPAT_pXO20044 [Bacillus anthracis str. SVA11]EDT16865.1 hypothetical protein BAM_B0087 [Bacillus anthracis str. A0465]